AQETGPRHLAGSRVLHLRLPVQPDQLLAVELMRVEPVTALIRQDLVLHGCKKGSQAVVILLRPAVKGMIVAASALETEAEEHLADGFCSNLRVSQCAIEVCRRMAIGTAAGGKQFSRELVQRFVVGNALPEPLVEYLHALPVEHLFFNAEQVRPLLRPELGKLRSLQYFVYEAATFIRPTIIEEPAGLDDRRQKAQGVKKRPA